MLIMFCRTAVIILDPPAAPIVTIGLPLLSITTVGLIELSGRLKG